MIGRLMGDLSCITSTVPQSKRPGELEFRRYGQVPIGW